MDADEMAVRRSVLNTTIEAVASADGTPIVFERTREGTPGDPAAPLLVGLRA
jgi:hypothetical protein